LIKSVSLRVNLVSTIIAMGFLGILLALYVGHVYQNMAVDNQRLAYEELLRLRVGDQFIALEKNAILLGQSIQNDKEFRAALSAQNKLKIAEYLESHFQQYLVSAGVLNLHSLHALDYELRAIGSAFTGSEVAQSGDMLGQSCHRLVRMRAGPGRHPAT